MAHNLYPVYPDAFPSEALQVFLGILKGEQADVACYAHAGWIIVGYALQQIAPHAHAGTAGVVGVGEEVDAYYTKDELVEVLEKATVKAGLDWTKLVDWKKLAKTVLLLIAERL